MAGAAPPTPASGSFYGWRIVAVAFLVDFIAVGFFFYSYPIFFKTIAAELGGGSRGGVGLGIAISNAVGALIAPFIGRALDRHSIKRMMIAGAGFVGVGFGLLSHITAIWQYYALLGSFLAGVLVWFIVSLFHVISSKSEVAALRRKNRQLARELTDLRNMPVSDLDPESLPAGPGEEDDREV